MKSYGSRFCGQCGRLFQRAEPDSQVCGACGEPPAVPAPAPARPAPAARPRPAVRREPRPRRGAAGANAGPVAGQRTLPMLRALANAPGGLTTPRLAEHASSAASWVNALSSTRMLMIKQERLGRVRQAGTVAGDRTRGSALWRITAEGERYVRERERV